MKPIDRWVVVLLSMVTATLLVNVLAIFAMLRLKSHAPLGFAVGMTAMFAFVGMLLLSQDQGQPWKITEASMRTAIAAAIVSQYLALIAMVTFAVGGPEKLSPIADTLVSSFTSIVGIVIAFYFGASAFVEAKRISADRRQSTDPDREPASR